MFSQALRASQASFKSVLSKAKRGLTSSRSNLSEMLEEVSQSMKINGVQEDLIILDSLNRTSYSTTFRAFDKTTRSFVAHRTISLTSRMAWSQIEMILEQYKNTNQNSYFSNVISIHYDKPANQVKVLTELDKTILGDVASYLANHPERLNEAFLEELTPQLVDLLDEAKSLNYRFEGLDLQSLFIDLKENRVKAHDLSSFEQNTRNDETSSTLEAVCDALTKITGAPKDAVTREFQKTMENLKLRSETQNNLNLIISDDYNKFMTEKLLKILEEKRSVRFIEDATLLKEALNQSHSEKSFGHIQALKQQEESLLSQARYYKTLDQFEKASKCYSEAFKATRKIERLEQAQKKSSLESSNLASSSSSSEDLTYKSPIVMYLDTLPRLLTQVIFPVLLLLLIFVICCQSLMRNEASWEDSKSYEAEIAAKKLAEEEEKSREKRQRLVQTLKFGLSVAIVSLSFIL